MNYVDHLLRPERLSGVADHLDEAIDEFRAWGVRISDRGRLPQMSQLLREIASRGKFPHEEEELSRLSEAIRNAQEFIEIANVLAESPFHSLQHDL